MDWQEDVPVHRKGKFRGTKSDRWTHETKSVKRNTIRDGRMFREAAEGKIGLTLETDGVVCIEPIIESKINKVVSEVKVKADHFKAVEITSNDNSPEENQRNKLIQVKDEPVSDEESSFDQSCCNLKSVDKTSLRFRDIHRETDMLHSNIAETEYVFNQIDELIDIIEEQYRTIERSCRYVEGNQTAAASEDEGKDIVEFISEKENNSIAKDFLFQSEKENVVAEKDLFFQNGEENASFEKDLLFPNQKENTDSRYNDDTGNDFAVNDITSIHVGDESHIRAEGRAQNDEHLIPSVVSIPVGDGSHIRAEGRVQNDAHLIPSVVINENVSTKREKGRDLIKKKRILKEGKSSAIKNKIFSTSIIPDKNDENYSDDNVVISKSAPTLPVSNKLPLRGEYKKIVKLINVEETDVTDNDLLFHNGDKDTRNEFAMSAKVNKCYTTVEDKPSIRVKEKEQKKHLVKDVHLVINENVSPKSKREKRRDLIKKESTLKKVKDRTNKDKICSTSGISEKKYEKNYRDVDFVITQSGPSEPVASKSPCQKRKELLHECQEVPAADDHKRKRRMKRLKEKKMHNEKNSLNDNLSRSPGKKKKKKSSDVEEDNFEMFLNNQNESLEKKKKADKWVYSDDSLSEFFCSSGDEIVYEERKKSRKKSTSNRKKWDREDDRVKSKKKSKSAVTDEGKGNKLRTTIRELSSGSEETYIPSGGKGEGQSSNTRKNITCGHKTQKLGIYDLFRKGELKVKKLKEKSKRKHF